MEGKLDFSLLLIFFCPFVLPPFILAENYTESKQTPGDRQKGTGSTQVVADLEKDETESRIKARPLKTASHESEKEDDISCKQEIRHREN